MRKPCEGCLFEGKDELGVKAYLGKEIIPVPHFKMCPKNCDIIHDLIREKEYYLCFTHFKEMKEIEKEFDELNKLDSIKIFDDTERIDLPKHGS